MNDYPTTLVSVAGNKIPQVSIGMPVYNGENFIREALDSLLAQTFTDFELIISDNASTDGTAAICQEYAESDARIRYVRQVENFGAAANFRYVMDEAVGEYFIWAAHDDLQHEEFLSSLVTVLDNNSQIVLVCSDVNNIDKQKSSLSNELLDSIRIDDAINDVKNNRAKFFRNPTTNIFFAIYGLYRIRILESVEQNYKNKVTYASGSEIPFLAQVALKGLIVSVPRILKMYRRHSESIYHSEQKGLRLFEFLENNLNISHVLFCIAFNSKLNGFDKLGLLAVIAYDYLLMPLRFFKRLMKSAGN